MVISLAVLASLAALVPLTIDPGRLRSVTWVLLGFFALRIALARARSR